MATETDQRSTEPERIDTLSRPKKVPTKYQDDRRSVYWVDYMPPKAGGNGVTVIVATPRVQELAAHRDPKNYKGDRPSPIWPVKDGAKTAERTPRIEELGNPKMVHKNHQSERSPYTDVSEDAKGAEATPRVKQLAEPKKREDRFGREETEWGQYFPVSDSAKQAKATERLEHLSEAKKYHNDFQDERPVQWPVTDSALKTAATLRIQQLARPRSRTMINDDFDPYKVSPAARRARGTPRIDELSAPIPRKVRPKKVA